MGLLIDLIILGIKISIFFTGVMIVIVVGIIVFGGLVNTFSELVEREKKPEDKEKKSNDYESNDIDDVEQSSEYEDNKSYIPFESEEEKLDRLVDEGATFEELEDEGYDYDEITEKLDY